MNFDLIVCIFLLNFPKKVHNLPIMSNNHHNNGSRAGETEQMAPARCLKVFIQRDYSDGTVVKFQTRFPQELEGRVSFRPLFDCFILK